MKRTKPKQPKPEPIKPLHYYVIIKLVIAEKLRGSAFWDQYYSK